MKQIALALVVFVAACSSNANNDNGSINASTNADAGVDSSTTVDVGADASTVPDSAVPPSPLAASDRGDRGVGNTTLTIEDTARGRTLDVEVWYPTDAAPAGEEITGFEQEPNLTTLADLLLAAGDCPNQQTGSTRDAAPLAGPWPLIVFSHCHACTRYSSFSVAEHLASWGYVVVAPDHEDNTLFDELDGTGAPFSEDFLAVRAADIGLVLDQVLDGDALPAGVSVDAERIGMMGHSFGSVTAGLVTQNDDRIGAALGFAAPMENPLLPGVTVADINVPLMFLVAVEDNSIREIGNRLIRDNFAKAQGEAWKVEVAEAGHWSFSDLAGLVEMFDAGCGEGTRQVGGDAFTFIDPVLGRTIAGAYALAFFEATLQDDAAARAFLDQPPPWSDVTLESATE